MKQQKPVIGITMGDPVGIGPEIVIKALSKASVFDICRPVVIGDKNVLYAASKIVGTDTVIHAIEKPSEGKYIPGVIDILSISHLDSENIPWGTPTPETGKAMAEYIIQAVEMTLDKKLDAMVTCPINKMSMNLSGYKYNGHTELLAEKTNTTEYAMMLTGKKLSVVLVTIHMALTDVPRNLSTSKIIEIIQITHTALKNRFGIKTPSIGIAGLNPHAGEEGMFGMEEETIITPAVKMARAEGVNVRGPFPPDTIFIDAIKGDYDAVVCMYHDQGLIPFKLIHFSDGVNTTLGLPIIRTSVDHGTAYNIAGTGKADERSLMEAIKMAARQAVCEVE